MSAFFSTAPLQNKLQKRGLDDSNERPLNYNIKILFKNTGWMERKIVFKLNARGRRQRRARHLLARARVRIYIQSPRAVQLSHLALASALAFVASICYLAVVHSPSLRIAWRHVVTNDITPG